MRRPLLGQQLDLAEATSGRIWQVSSDTSLLLESLLHGSQASHAFGGTAELRRSHRTHGQRVVGNSKADR
ncbi:hypothetical protein DIPPA_32836 [Diplonema papillatum]|nr:hypothetical protein DIPPA_32836 [Diplonema papillatum]